MLQVMPCDAWDTNEGSIVPTEDTHGAAVISAPATCSTKPHWAVSIPGPHSH